MFHNTVFTMLLFFEIEKTITEFENNFVNHYVILPSQLYSLLYAIFLFTEYLEPNFHYCYL